MVEGVAVPSVSVDRRKSGIDSWCAAAREEVTCIVRGAVAGPARRSKHVQGGVVLQMLAPGAHIGHTGRRPAYDFTLYVETPLISGGQRRIGFVVQTGSRTGRHHCRIDFQNARSWTKQRKGPGDMGHGSIGVTQDGRDQLLMKNAHARPHRSPSVPERIPCQPESRSKIVSGRDKERLPQCWSAIEETLHAGGAAIPLLGSGRELLPQSDCER